MNLTLWILQVLLALHTLMGALWKFSNSSQADPVMRAIPHGVWLGMSVVEILCSVALVLPIFSRRGGALAPLAAAFITAEMLLFVVLFVVSGSVEYGHVVYWLVVAALAGFVAQGRRSLAPHQHARQEG
jgi:hypothetical protein